MKTLLLSAFLAFAAQDWSGPALLSSPLASGALWGKTLEEAAASLGVSPSAQTPAPAPAWFLEGAFLRLWGLPSGEGFTTVLAAPETWLILREGRLFGMVRRVPLAAWDSYEAPARKRLGAPSRRHFVVERSSVPVRDLSGRGSPESEPMDSPKTRFIHVYKWAGAKTAVCIVKATWRDDFAQWQTTQKGTVMRVRLMQKADDESVPLFVTAFKR